VEALADALRYVTAMLALALAVVTVARIHRGGDARRWGAAAFVALAVVLLESAFGGRGSSGWAGRVLICVLLAFP
jgi:hypothetical protein